MQPENAKQSIITTHWQTNKQKHSHFNAPEPTHIPGTSEAKTQFN